MKSGLKFMLAGIFFGIIMAKTEAISWYRIQEMFRFQAFHMYGLIGSAVGIGILVVGAIKKFKIKNIYGEPIVFHPKERSISRYLLGGTIFGMGWALTGACPGPLAVHIGQGVGVMVIVMLSASFGTLIYGAIREKLPH
ncbi:DUF6691 family protein [Xanthovirga aplysinae]|uniref:DUF6691 family protein n=1 Tax=Xanthovirga aplysinae TaxID=2529853 RepID=UPI0012BCBAEC|nr:DUF6691 family protein [Xanthovirga aplysinae]MTI32949.1 YeeE/YedE family protein [Xanthovirga aplysinae]